MSKPLLGHTPVGRLFVRNRFVALLLTLILLLITAPIVATIDIETRSGVAQAAVSAAFFLLLVSSVAAVAPTRSAVWLALGLAAPSLALQLFTAFSQHRMIVTTNYVLSVPFLAYVIMVITGHLFRTRRVSLDTICAAASVYLLIGLLWSLVDSMVELHAPGSYAVLVDGSNGTANMAFGARHTVVALYYSFITLTTLGYGDIVPVSATARMLAAVEAVVGQLFIALLVARLVGLHVAQMEHARPQPPDQE